MKSPDPRWWKDKRILVTGADGFIGGRVFAVLDQLGLARPSNIRPYSLPDGDLRSPPDARWAVKGSDVVLHLAADVGGAGYSSTHSADQYSSCSAIDLAVVEAARDAGAARVVILSCATAYPATASSPLVEHAMFEGQPRDSHLGYGLAKRNGLVLAGLYARQHHMSISGIVASNAYGPGDHFDETAQVVASLIRGCCSGADTLLVRGDGSPIRDFVYVDDLVTGLLLAAEHLAPGTFVNVGSGAETSVASLVDKIVELTGFTGTVQFDRSQPVGQLRRTLDISKASKEIGYAPETTLEEGLRRTIDWYRTEKKGEI